MPIAAFLKNATLRMPTVNATTVTFAETSEETGKYQKSSGGNRFLVNYYILFQIHEM